MSNRKRKLHPAQLEIIKCGQDAQRTNGTLEEEEAEQTKQRETHSTITQTLPLYSNESVVQQQNITQPTQEGRRKLREVIAELVEIWDSPVSDPLDTPEMKRRKQKKLKALAQGEKETS